MILVLDTSVALSFLLKTESGGNFEETLLNARKIYSCDLFKAELANGLWQYVRANEITKDEAIALFSKGIQLVDEYINEESLALEAISAAVRYQHPVYDMFYLILTRRQDANLLTLDKKLSQLALNEGLSVNKLVE
jgi:predicted nucleic acid-binding protein